MNTRAREPRTSANADHSDDDRTILGVPWAARQVLKVAALIALVILAAREADLDAKALAEARARGSLLAAVERESKRTPHSAASPEMDRLVASYEIACRACARPETCSEILRNIRAGSPSPQGKGPCKKGIFWRWSSDDPAPDRR